MVSIDPRSFAVGSSFAGRIAGFVAVAVGLGLAAHGWIGLVGAIEERDSDAYVCAEDKNGCAPIAVELPGQAAPDVDSDALVVDVKNAVGDDEVLADVDAVDDLGEADLPSGGAAMQQVVAAVPVAVRASGPAAVPSPTSASPAELRGPLSTLLTCLVGDTRGGCLRWEQLPAADQALLEDLFRRHGVRMP